MSNQDTDKKTKKNNHKLGTSNNPVTDYTINDCLTPKQVAQKFDTSIEQVRKIMRKMEANQESTLLNGHYKPAIIRVGHSSTKRLHPTGFGIFEQYLQREKQ